MTGNPQEGGISAPGRPRELARELIALRDRLRMGGGEKRIRRQHDQGKLTARERIRLLLDPGRFWLELGLLVAHDRYQGQALGTGIVTDLGVMEGKKIVMVANDATVKAGS